MLGFHSQTLPALAATLLLTACTHTPAAVSPAPPPQPCALILTDDDIPSGSATAGALYVEDAELGRQLLTADVLAAARGFLRAGQSCVHVVDSHNGAIDPEPLAELGVSVLTPDNQQVWTWPFLGPMEADYAVAALMGFHSNAGAEGFRPHTINDAIRSLSIQGRELGEVAHLSLGLAGMGIPVGLVSGDMNATAEARALNPDVQAVTVRWLDEDGQPAFSSSEEASSALDAAAFAASELPAGKLELVPPLEIRLQTWSRERMEDLGRGLPEAYGAYLEAERPALEAHPLGSRVFASGLATGPVQVEGYGITWLEQDPLAAYHSIAFAAWSLRGDSSGWDAVSEGYRAYSQGLHDQALAAYQRALELDPYDVATRCRMGAAYQALGQLEQALASYEYALARLDEVREPPMKRWCQEGHAEVAQQLDDGGPGAAAE